MREESGAHPKNLSIQATLIEIPPAFDVGQKQDDGCALFGSTASSNSPFHPKASAANILLLLFDLSAGSCIIFFCERIELGLVSGGPVRLCTNQLGKLL